jgi:hypothetical protein
MERSEKMKGTALIEYCGNGMYRYIDCDGIEHILREPVKCKDCKYWVENKTTRGSYRNCIFSKTMMRADDFCSRGEHK